MSGPAVPSLAWLISPVSKAQFFEQYWERQPLVLNRDSRDYFSELLSLDSVDRVITTLDRRYPDIILKNADAEVADSEYVMAGGVLDIAKLYQLFEKGFTITLSFLDTVVPSLTLFCRALENELSFPFQTNVYLTPPGAQGAQPHYDTHDVFVLQVAGSKKWNVFGTPVELPLPGQSFNAKLHELGACTQEFELRAGDMAYIPRGIAHEARSTDSVSLHITAGILKYTWADLLLEWVAAASLEDSALRRSLPPGFAQSGFDKTAAREMLRDLLKRAENSSSFDAVFDSFVDRLINACPPLLDGQMKELAALGRLTGESVVGARPGVISRLETSDGSVSLACFGRTITFPPQAQEALRFALEHARFAVNTLPGRLDEAGKLTLVRRLIREGLLVHSMN